MSKIKSYFCDNCKQTSDAIGITQQEAHHYSMDLETHDWDDIHGSESVESQEFFCLNCEHEISDFELN